MEHGYRGVAQNDIGIKTDILDNIPKAIGMKMLIRSMTPDVICADEIGSLEDVEAINYAMCSGIKGVFTAHRCYTRRYFFKSLFK